ncbi:phage terminase large subunit [Roseospirillum parvum]|uniref:Terminase large subunit gp17-like C-terminal domain-containing protein n=1 Tax=Roseospirillum parvum TaxID=83401 RepID=A0A1G7U7R4_9PROT|nr:phage terminase large subunit [Roseospirillum parvum]SDG43331.1 hypothetical protein SAMN05421742_101232 [Roseospirillum parvum]
MSKTDPPAGAVHLGVDFIEFLYIWNALEGQATPAHQRRMARWLAARWRRRRRRGEGQALLMAFRNSGKSTVVGLFCAWLLLDNPSLRILVMAADHALAKKMVRNVKRIIERHPLTRHLKPPRRDQWAADQFTVARPRELRDPSMLAKGVGANVTGSRADIIVCDDVEVPNTCDTAPKRADLRQRLSELDYVLVPGGLSLYVGTPHTYNTIYAAEPCRDMGEAVPFLAGFARLEIPIEDAHHRPAWPERFPVERIAALRRRSGPNKFASQMMLKPMNIAEGRLDPEALRLYEAELDYSEAAGEVILRLDGRRLVSASCFWDPAFGARALDAKGAGDGSVIAIVFADEAGGYWLHRIAWLTHDPRHPVEPATQMCRQVAAFAADTLAPAVCVETNGLGRFLPGILRRELAAAGLACGVIEKASSTPKDQRIVEAFDAILAARALHVHRSVWGTPLVAEMREWRPGLGKGHDDGLDAVAACLLNEPVRLGRPTRPANAPWRGGWRRGPWNAPSGFEV